MQLALNSVDKVNNIDRHEFTRDYFRPLRPLIIKDMASDWPALKKWTPEFFKKQHGDKLIKVYDASFVSAGKHYMSGVQTLSFSDYIDQVMHTTQDLRMFLYNIKSEIPELVSDVEFPKIVNGISKNFLFMFFGCKGSVTQMHFDIDMSHVFHTSLHGKKTVTLFPYEEGKNLHRFPFTCRSYVDVHKPDFEHYPGLKSATGYQVQLQAGETLYIPSGYWHHFVYDEASYSLSLRCSPADWRSKALGLYNLLIMQSIDRGMNRILPDGWFDWKQQQALQRN